MTTQETTLAPDKVRARLFLALKDAGLTITPRFVPWIESRMRDDKEPSLNWLVEIWHQGQPWQLAAPFHMLDVPHTEFARRAPSFTIERGITSEVIKECMTGEDAATGKKIAPDEIAFFANVLYEANACTFGGYEAFAEAFGLDPDSRKGEAIYKKCKGIGLAFRATIGQQKLVELQEQFSKFKPE